MLTADGVKSIDDVEVGGTVLARDVETGELVERRVVDTSVRHDVPLIRLVVTTATGDRSLLDVTPGHPFWLGAEGWVEAGRLRRGDVLEDADGQAVRVLSAVPSGERGTVFNLEVEGAHTYFAGAAEVLVHNGACGNGDGPSFPGNDPANAPPGFRWRGRAGSKPGSKEGNYHNPETGESLRPDLDHPDPIGPHWNYKNPSKKWWRLKPDGTKEPK